MKSGESDVGILEKGVLSSGPSLLVGGGSVIWFGAVHVDLSFAPSVLGYHVRVVDSDHCEWSVETRRDFVGALFADENLISCFIRFSDSALSEVVVVFLFFLSLCDVGARLLPNGLEKSDQLINVVVLVGESLAW